MIFGGLGHHLRLLGRNEDGLADWSVLNLGVCRALGISQQTTSIPWLDPLVNWRAVHQPHVSLRTHQAGQGSSV